MVSQSNDDSDILSKLGAEPVDDSDTLSKLGAEPVDDSDTLSKLGAESIDTELSTNEQVLGAINATSNIIPIAKQFGNKVFSAVQGIESNNNMQALDPATKTGLILNKLVSDIFDEGGELTAMRLAESGLNPYVSAGIGTTVSKFPDIAFSVEGLAAIKAAGNARAQSELLDRIARATKVFENKPLAIQYKPGLGPIEAPTTVIESGKPISLESKELSLLKGKTPLALPEPKVTQGPSFTMRNEPDLAKLQNAELLSGVPKYPQNMGNTKSMRGYVSRRKLSSDIPQFNNLYNVIAPADKFNPTVSELVDESRSQYVGIDPRLQIVKNNETGRVTFKLKNDPVVENRVTTESEHISNEITKNSVIVNELGIDNRIVDSSPILPGSETVPVLKEGIVAGSRSWMQDAWNRIGASAEDVISRMGNSGKEFASMIRTLRDVPQVRYGEFTANFDNFLKGLNKQQAKQVSINLTDALEGRQTSGKLPDGLLEFVQQKLKVIADEASAVNIQVRTSNGEYVPFAPKENYFPRVLRQEIFDGLISGDNKLMRDIAQKMVNNKSEPNIHVAFERVRFIRNKLSTNKFGHLERAREAQLPPELYDRNSLRVIPEYINTALHRIEEVRLFGVDGEKALEILSRIESEGYDAKLARTIFERFTRIEPRDSVYLKGAQGLRNLAAGTLIQAQSTALQLGQLVTPAYEAGFRLAIKNFFKAFTALGENEAKRAGQIFTNAAQDYLKESYGGGSYGFGAKLAESALNLSGFTRMDHFLRKYSALVGKDYINELVPKAIKGNKRAIIELEHLGFNASEIKRTNGISEEQLNIGAKRFSDNVQGAPDVTRLPEFWTTWQGKLLGQFKNFSYVIGKQNASMIKRALQTGNVTRLGEMAVGLPLTGYVISELKKSMVGESNSEITGNEDVDKIVEVLANATAFGPSVDLFMQAIQGPMKLKNYFMPISVSNVADVLGSIGQSIKTQDSEQISKSLLKKTPIIGKILSNKIYGE